jgi:hypothetical protein
MSRGIQMWGLFINQRVGKSFQTCYYVALLKGKMRKLGLKKIPT